MRARGAIPYLMLGSLAVHAAVIYGWDPGFLAKENAAQRQPDVIELVPLNPGLAPATAPGMQLVPAPNSQPEPLPPPRPARGQVVETPNLLESPTPPENARFLSERNIRVAKETAGPTSDRPGFSGSPHPPSPPAGGPPVPELKRVQVQEAPAEGPGPGFEARKLYPSYRDLWQLSPSPGAKESSSPAGAGDLLGVPGGRIDYLDGVVAGEITALNTQAFRFAAFYNRIKAAVRAYWDPSSAVLRSGQPRHDLDTYVRVVTDAQGKLVSPPEVIHSCGYPAVDEAAVRAIQQATPFFGVPEAVLNDKKQFDEVWGFHVILR